MIRTFRGRERGMSAIPFVVSLILVLVFAGMWFSQSSDNDKYVSSANAAKAAAKEWQDKWQDADRQLNALAEVTGWTNPQGKPDPEQIKAAMTGAVEKWREKLAIEFAADKYTPTGNGGEVEKLQGDKVRVVYLPAKDQVTVTNLQSLLPTFENAATRMQNDIKRTVEALDAEKKSKAAAQEAFNRALAEKDAARTALQASDEQLRRSLDEQIKDLRDQVQAKDGQIAQATTELEQVKADAAKEKSALQSQLGQREAEIRTLVSREQPFVNEGPDGEVVGAGSGMAVINLGKRDMLMAGTKFTVLGRVKGLDLIQKGSIEVVTCKDQTAECRILSDSPSNPIGMGDLIQSPTYSPNRKMHFCLIGDFRKMGRTQAEARLRQLGAVVDAHVSTETHYLVVGSLENMEENEEYRMAKQFNVTPITEAQLASFTMY